MSSVDNLNLNSVPEIQTPMTKTVEGRLWVTLRTLADTEGNIKLFNTLKSLGTATNDVRNFVLKQSKHRRVNNCIDAKVMRVAMTSKLKDAYAYAKRLRQDKNIIKSRILKKYRNSSTEGKKVISKLISKYRSYKLKVMDDVERKAVFLKEKNNAADKIRESPPHTQEILSGVNLFSSVQKDLKKEDPLGPFICDPKIQLTNNELLLLSRGPKYMVREDLSEDVFDIEIEKMIAKQKYNDGFMEEDLSECTSQEQPPAHCDKSIASCHSPSESKVSGNDKFKFMQRWDEASGSMIFNELSGTLDLGNLKATNYKYNKEIFPPKNDSVNCEAGHEARKVELKRVFQRITKPIKPKETNNSSSKHQKIPSIQSESNLSEKELEGLKSLKRKIKEGILVVCDTDKSKRFCVMTPDQYLKSGYVHTSKDLEISPSQIARVQNHVNDHTWWLKNITNCGSNWRHEDRMCKNVLDKGEQVCNMVLLVKDHKNWKPGSDSPPPSRPVVSGNTGLNCHLSEMLSLILEPITSQANGHEVDSTLEMLSKVEGLNEKFLSSSIENSSQGVSENNSSHDTSSNSSQGCNSSPDTTEDSLSHVNSNVSEGCTKDGQTDQIIEPRSKNDIRYYGLKGSQTSIPSKLNNADISKRIDSLRNSKCEGLLPNLSNRVKAGTLLDQIEGSQPIKVQEGELDSSKTPSIQKPGLSNVCFTGADVVSLFPSLKAVEAARLARCAVVESDVKFENFNYQMALRYLMIVGGIQMLDGAKLGRLAPKWKGKRGDMLSVGGKKSKDVNFWQDSNRNMFESDKRRIVGLLVETLVNLIMSTHIYTFAGKFYIQSGGGPIGLRSTACLASLIMKLVDMAWVKLAKREGLELHLYYRYVDDVRNCLQALIEGVRWNGGKFEWKAEWQAEDLESGKTDLARTTDEVAKAMSSLVSYLVFEGEHAGMFESQKLPTLDTSIWWNGSKLCFEFYEKPMCPNRVLQKDTALSTSTIRASLNQEVVRRLLCCSQDLPLVRKQEILSTFSQKLLNSGFSLASAQIILVHGTTRYLEMLKCSRLEKTHPNFKPLYWDKSYNRLGRILKKYESKTGWYSTDSKVKNVWRMALPKKWKGARPLQQKVHGLDYTTVLNVPNSRGSRLLKEIAKIEPRMCKSTGYQVKLVESSGKPLSTMFPKSVALTKCHRIDCSPCSNPNVKGPSLCSVKNVVYEGSCNICQAEFNSSPGSKHKGIYIGQTYRTLYERSIEHFGSYRREESSSFMFKHWATVHRDLSSPPKFNFKVLSCHKDPLTRMIDEAVKISKVASMNSKSEFKSFKLNRIKIDKSSWEVKKEEIEEDKVTEAEEEAMSQLRVKISNLNVPPPLLIIILFAEKGWIDQPTHKLQQKFPLLQLRGTG